MAANKTYWKNAEQLNENSPLVDQLEQKEFAEYVPVNEFLEDKESLEDSSTSRRDFLKYVGFSTAAASLAACEGPVIKSVPYVVQPEQIRPGVANYYATAIADGFDFGSMRNTYNNACNRFYCRRLILLLVLNIKIKMFYLFLLCHEVIDVDFLYMLHMFFFGYL